MKVLYIGNYADGTGYSQAAIGNILALDAVGVDVVPRVIKLNNRNSEVPTRIMELESKPSQGCDIVIQHVLPHYMQYDGHFTANIGLFASETSDFSSSNWSEHLNIMDEVWVINKQQIAACINSKVNKPINVVPHAFDISKYTRSYSPLDIPSNGESFKFYFIAENVRRKNLTAVIRAFHTEFDIHENVDLIIKTHQEGLSDEQVYNNVNALCNTIKLGLKLYNKDENYKKEVVITQRLKEEDIMRLHHTCDCFVCPSYGEAWSIPTFDALAMGKTPIVTNSTGFRDYIDNSVGWLIDSYKEQVFGANDSFNDLYVGTEYWDVIQMQGLRQAMREAFSNSALRQKKAGNGLDRAMDFSYHAVGNKMKGFLSTCLEKNLSKQSTKNLLSVKN